MSAPDLPIVATLSSAKEALLEHLATCLAGSSGIASGPDGNGGMKVVVYFAEPKQEQALFWLLNDADLRARGEEVGNG